MDIKYQHIPVTIAFTDYEDGVKDLVQKLGVSWKRENINIEVNLYQKNKNLMWHFIVHKCLNYHLHYNILNYSC